jgi:NADH dehydrogenase [ubiquinone] 1 alpha subcomplex assembly factor 7
LQDRGKTPFIIAHEFFDALPIHAFQSVSPSQPDITTSATAPPLHRQSTPQWRELVVTPTPPDSTHSTLATPRSQQHNNTPPEFQLSLAKAATPHSLLLPETSQRYKALKPLPGATIEICPEGQSYAAEFARRIGGEKGQAASGAALILDYGPASTVPVNSLRGIRVHKTVSPFSSPGLVDLSADVDFTALAKAALAASPGVEVHGPVEQSSFLQAMGIRERADQLLRGVPEGDDEKKDRLEGSWRRLVGRGVGGMGKVYKAMAIVPLSDGKRRPVGFGGDVEG